MSRRRTAVTSQLVVGMTMRGHLFLLGLWAQPPGRAGWTVPVDQVLDTVALVFRQYNVIGFGADPAGWEGIVAGWEATYGEKLEVKAGATPIAYRFNRTGIVARDTLGLHDAIVNREITVEDHPLLRAHFLNARNRPSTQGIQLRKEHPSATARSTPRSRP